MTLPELANGRSIVNMNKPRVSVVILTRNMDCLVPEAIECILFTA
jgi:hypothetical protein